MRKHLFTVRLMEQWYRVARELLKSPSLEICKSHLDMVLGSWLKMALLEQGGDGQDDLQESLLDQAVGFCVADKERVLPQLPLEELHQGTPLSSRMSARFLSCITAICQVGGQPQRMR